MKTLFNAGDKVWASDLRRWAVVKEILKRGWMVIELADSSVSFYSRTGRKGGKRLLFSSEDGAK